MNVNMCATCRGRGRLKNGQGCSDCGTQGFRGEVRVEVTPGLAIDLITGGGQAFVGCPSVAIVYVQEYERPLLETKLG